MPNFYSTLRRLALTALLSGGGLLAAQAQTLSQPLTGATTVAGTYTDLGTTGSVITTTNTDNANSAAQNIGFSFGYNGAVFTQFVLNTNGLIRLGSAAPSSAALYIDSNTPAVGIDPVQSLNAADVNLILPFNLDLISGSAGTAEYRVNTTGTAGSRICTIQWKNVADKAGTGAGAAQQYSNFNFQLKLYEGLGTIEFVYDAPTASAAAANSRDTNVGLKGSGIANSQLLLASKTSTAAWSAPVFQNTGYGVNTFSIDKTALPTAGRIYRFTDPTYCLPVASATYPYTQNFDGVTAPALPCGITVVDGNADNNTWATYNGNASSTPNSIRYVGNTAIANDWFFTSPLTMTAGMSYQMQFKYRSSSATTTQGLELKVGNAATIAGQTTTLYANTSITNATYNTTNNTQVVLFTPTTTGTYYFGFHAISAPSQLWLHVDDLQVTEVATPACPQPTNITLSSVTATTATVSFTPPTGGTTYSVIYGPKNFTPPTGGTATPLSSSTSVALTGLNSNTAYDVYVQATCGTAGTSVYTGPIAFTTACAASTGFPYNENFDTVTAPALPCGITVVDSNNDGSTWANFSSTTLSSSTPNVMRYTASTTNAANDWFFTNGLAMTVGNSYQLQFKYRSGATANTQGLEVKAGAAATAAGQTATVFSNPSFNNITYTTTTNAQVVLFTPTASGTYYFGFHAISAANQSFFYVDDVQVTQVATPACVNPGAPAVSAVTATGATVTFTGPTNATGYSVIYGPAGFTPSSSSSSTPVAAGTSITLTGLNSNTPYDVYVQATCGTSGTSILTGPVSFRTACATVTAYPYLEDFESVTAPALPCGMSVINVNNDTGVWANLSNAANAASGTNAMTYNWNGTNPGDDWFFTNALQMRVGYSYQLQFKYRSSNAVPEAMEVKVGNAATVAAQTTTVFTNTNIINTTYTTTVAGSGAGQVLLFTPTTAGTYFFGFHDISVANQWYLYVDDLQVTEVVSPACPQPTALVVSGITTTGATVSFNGPTNGSSYTVIYGPRGFTAPGGGTAAPAGATSPITLTGLTSNTPYDVYVQATCSGTAGSSTLTGPVSFTTACATVTTFPYLETFDGVTAPALPCGITIINVNNDSGVWANVNSTGSTGSTPNAMMYNWNGTNAANDWFFTNALSLQAGATYQLQFKYRTSNAQGEAMEVKVGNAATVAGQTTTVFTNNNITNTAYVTTTAGTATGQVAGFTPTTSGIYYFGFHATSAANRWNLYVDDVRVDAVSLAACPTPTNVTLSGITASTATVSFTGPTALATGGYTVIYGPAGFDPTVTTNPLRKTQTGPASPITLTGLTSLTGYDVYVVASCAASVTSFTSAKVSFTSACATTVTFDYIEKFDNVTAPALPCGVTVLDANNDGNTWGNSNFNPSSGANSMRYNPSPVNAADDWFFTNALALKSNMKYQLEFKYRVFTYNYPEKMEVKIGTSTTAASQTTTLFSNTAIINTAYTLTSPGSQTGQVIGFTPPADGTYFIGFHAMSLANYFDIYVDDIRVSASAITATKSNVAPGFSAEASPVPFGDRLTLNLTTLKAGPLQLTLHDAVGRVVRETTANVPVGASSLAVPNAGSLPAGMYILTVRQGGNTQVIRVAHE